MSLTPQEQQLEDIVAYWAKVEADKAAADAEIDECKEKVKTLMREMGGLKQHVSPLHGTVSLIKKSKLTILVDRKDFDAALKKTGEYNKFVVSKFSLDEVSKYVEATINAGEEDNLHGMVEFDPDGSTYPKFTAKPKLADKIKGVNPT